MDILFEDEALVVVSKPSGLRTIPDGYNPQLPCAWKELEKQIGRLWVVHRLDKETSGVLIFAKTPGAHRSLNAQFEKHTIQKEYRCCVAGKPDWQTVTISAPLRVNGDRAHRTIVDFHRGKPACTEFRWLCLREWYSEIVVLPYNGYTHQIRSHLAYIGFPILGDPLYKSRLPNLTAPPPFQVSRLALHARHILFNHPLTLSPLSIAAAIPEDFYPRN